MRKETPEEKQPGTGQLVDSFWLAAAAATTLAAGIKAGTEEVCSTPSRNRVKKLSHPSQGTN